MRRRRRPDAGQRQGRPELRHRPARDPAPGPGRGDGRRNPRPRDGRHRRAGLADRPPRALDRPHQRRVGAITRLRDMKIEPFLLASTLRAVIAQRLVRRLCPTCREPSRRPARLAPARLRPPAPSSTRRAAAASAATPAIRAGSACSRRCGRRHDPPPDQRRRRRGGDRRHAFRNAPNLGSAARALVREGVTTAEEASGVAARERECLSCAAASPIWRSTPPGASGAGSVRAASAEERARRALSARKLYVVGWKPTGAPARPCCRAARCRAAAAAQEAGPSS
jgi:hypothetical protein